MKINGKDWRTIWLESGGRSVGVIDQTCLPHRFSTSSLFNCDDVAKAISKMVVRGAPLIGVTGAYGLMLALQEDPSDYSLKIAFEKLNQTRPTAVNLSWALNRVKEKVSLLPYSERAIVARKEADLIAKEDICMCESIGDYGLGLFKNLMNSRPVERKGKPLKILTHCNAGWLATVDWGTALAPIYKAHRYGLDIHIWVDETRPRNQGSSLTAYELGCEGIPHTVIVDNAGGYLMQKGEVDAVIVGSDRTSSCGDVCNKIGTYLKALAAFDNQVPFYVALPSSTIDWSIEDGLSNIPVEFRSANEVTYIRGKHFSSKDKIEIIDVRLTPPDTESLNPSFDITPAKYITSLITEKGVFACDKESMQRIKMAISNH